MDIMRLNIAIFCCFLLKSHNIKAQFNNTLYKQMPPLHNFEDYDDCLGVPSNQSQASTYCIVFAEIASNETSLLWKIISQFSTDHKRHFRHDHLFFGSCLERCRKLFTQFSISERNELYVGKVEDTDLIAYFADVHKRETDERARFDHIVGSCLNHDFRHRYNLTLRTSIEYCEVANKPLKYDLLDYVIYVIFAFLVLCNIFSTIYDYHLKRKTPLNSHQFYKIDPPSKADSLLTSFSICRNYYRIIQPAANMTIKDLSFLNAYRVFGIFLVIFAHVLMLFFAVQIQNPEFFEQFFYRIETAFIQNGSLVIQIFFVISGFLLNVNFQEKQLISKKSKLSECFVVYFKLCAFRYLRLVPSLILLILFNATILTRLQDGPFWRHYTEAERVFCREYWWKNILLINNYTMKKSCSHQTWYIAADMQLFELYALVLITVTIYPRLKKIIFTILIICSVGIPALITYVLKFEAIYHMAPENYRYLYFKDVEIYYQTYPPFYTNIGGYLFGIISADIYIKAKHKNILHKFKGLLVYELLWWLIFPASFALLLLGDVFMSLDLDTPSIWIALFSGFYKTFWVLICCIALLGMCFKLGWIAYDMCKMSLFYPLARVSYQSFIWHVVVLRLLGGFYRQPIYINRFSLACNVILGFVLTHIVAFFFAISMEFPIASMLKCLALKSKDNSNTKSEHKPKLDKIVMTVQNLPDDR